MQTLNVFGPSAFQKFVRQDNACDLGIPRARYFRQRIPQHTVHKTNGGNGNSCEEQVVVLLTQRPDLG